MKYTVIIIALFFVQLRAQEILHIPCDNGEVIEGRLSIPDSGFTNKLVIDVPGSGPQTYVNIRKAGNRLYNYHDYFMNEFDRRGIAYFSYSTRYTEPDPTNPPYYDNVNKQKFINYTPTMKVEDLESIINYLRQDKRLDSSKFLLLGFSEGALIAAMAAERENVPIDGLFLCGTPIDNVYDIMIWQLSGESSMINFRKYFDVNRDGVIHIVEYEEADPGARARVGNKTFSELDIDKNMKLTASDFKTILKPRLHQLLNAIENNDNNWIWKNYFRVGIPWIKEHKTLEPNRTRLLKLNLPVYLFHGVYDANCPVEPVIELQRAAREENKENIHVFIIPECDHTLDFLTWVVQNTIPEALKKLFSEIDNF